MVKCLLEVTYNSKVLCSPEHKSYGTSQRTSVNISSLIGNYVKIIWEIHESLSSETDQNFFNGKKPKPSRPTERAKEPSKKLHR